MQRAPPGRPDGGIRGPTTPSESTETAILGHAPTDRVGSSTPRLTSAVYGIDPDILRSIEEWEDGWKRLRERDNPDSPLPGKR